MRFLNFYKYREFINTKSSICNKKKLANAILMHDINLAL